MPLQTIDFTKIPLQRSVNPALEGLFSGGVESYMGAKRHKEDTRAKELANALMEQYGGREKEAELAYKDAMTQYYSGQVGKPESDVGKLFKDYDRVVQEQGPDSEQARILRDVAEKKARGPENKLPAQVVAKTVNGQIANDQRVYMADHLEQPYVGAQSNTVLMNDFFRYKNTKDPMEKKALGFKLAKAVNADKLAPEYANLQLASQGITATKFAKKGQEDAIKQGWPESLAWFKNNMPKEIQELANELHSEALKNLTNIRNQAYNKYAAGKQTAIYNGYGEEMRSEGYNPDEVEYAY